MNWRRLAFPGYKNGKIPGFHTPRYCLEAIVKLEREHERECSMEIIAGFLNDEKVLISGLKTIFLPWQTEYEIDCLFNKACMNIKTMQFRQRWGVWKFISKPINGQRYQWFINSEGEIKTFFPINLAE